MGGSRFGRERKLASSCPQRRRHELPHHRAALAAQLQKLRAHQCSCGIEDSPWRDSADCCDFRLEGLRFMRRASGDLLRRSLRAARGHGQAGRSAVPTRDFASDAVAQSAHTGEGAGVVMRSCIE